MDGIKIVKNIAQKLGDIKFVNKVLLEQDNYLDLGDIKFYPNIPLALSHGLPGLCLLYNELHKLYPNEGWNDLCNNYIKTIVDYIQEEGLQSSSLFSGTSGIALAVKACSNNGAYYKSLLQTLDNHLYSQLDVNLNYIINKTDTEMFDYDVIEGMSGIGNYLLLNNKERPLEKILNYFVNLSKPVSHLNFEVPRWFIKKEHLFNDDEKKYYNKGILNLGLSHGIPGPLIILCKSYNKNIIVDGQKEAIEKIVGDIIKCKIKGTNQWNGMIGLDEYINGAKNSDAVRDAWCYGTPGIAYSLLGASYTLKNNSLYEMSCEAMKESVKNENGLFSPSFCHGYSGLAYISYKFYCKTKDKFFLNESDRLLEKILSYYTDDAPFGFYNIENSSSNIKNLNSIALLDGASGTLLTILELISKTNSVDWDSAFLLDN